MGRGQVILTRFFIINALRDCARFIIQATAQLTHDAISIRAPAYLTYARLFPAGNRALREGLRNFGLSD
jgi:hypothetical protein